MNDRHKNDRNTNDRRKTLARRLVTALAAAALAAVALVGAAKPAAAHSGDQSYLYLDIGKNTVAGHIEAPLKDINKVFNLKIVGDTQQATALLLASEAPLKEYFAKHLELGAGGKKWPITFTETRLFYSDLPEQDGNYAMFFFTADAGSDIVPRAIESRFDPFFDEIPGRDSLVLIGNDWSGGVIENSHGVFGRYDSGSRNLVLNLGDTGWFKNVKASAKLGLNHIRTGPDHILFVLVLVLPSVLVFAGRWRPTKSFRASLWRVLKVVTMFTLAHSITFTLAGLDLLPLPPTKVIEAVIAISIAAAALHNLRPIFPNKEWLISFAFGLFHGLGFAGLVATLDVPRSTQLVSLLGRNIGIEIGQSIVVLLVFPALFLLRRTRYFRPFFVTASIVLTVISISWMIERLFEVDLGVSNRVDPVVEFPRVLIPLAICTVIAAVANRLEHRKNRLLTAVDTVPLGRSTAPATDDALTNA
jgi:hypothetical protein